MSTSQTTWSRAPISTYCVVGFCWEQSVLTEIIILPPPPHIPCLFPSRPHAKLPQKPPEGNVRGKAATNNQTRQIMCMLHGWMSVLDTKLQEISSQSILQQGRLAPPPQQLLGVHRSHAKSYQLHDVCHPCPVQSPAGLTHVRCAGGLPKPSQGSVLFQHVHVLLENALPHRAVHQKLHTQMRK